MITCQAAEKLRISVAEKAVSASISIGACMDKMSIKLRCLYLPLNNGIQPITRYARFAAGRMKPRWNRRAVSFIFIRRLGVLLRCAVA